MAEKDGRYNLTIAIHNTARIILKKKNNNREWAKDKITGMLEFFLTKKNIYTLRQGILHI